MIDLLQLALLIFIAYVLWDQHHPALPVIGKRSPKHKVILDTCALIDGRIAELSHAGFVPEELIVPEFVLHELQLLADGADPHKRERARFGLDVVQELQDSSSVAVIIDHSQIPEKHAIDDKLVALAKRLNARLYTTDYNLNKVAEIEGVRVMNVNELAQQLRPTALPGEHKTVKIVQKGSSAKQGVGYLDDGTMIVVEDAAGLVGKSVSVEVTRTHQTVAGKMLFGDLATLPAPKRTVSGPRMAAQKPASTLAARMKRKARQINS
jgi:uncharacterized protein YacL